jgi:hypothetical protein
MYGPWYCHHNPIDYQIAQKADNKTAQKRQAECDAAQLRHLIQLRPGDVKKWSAEKDGYLLFFHILVPGDSNRSEERWRGEPQILRATVYQLESDDCKLKYVKAIAFFPEAVHQGKAINNDQQFQNAVKEQLEEKGFTLPEDPPKGKGKGKGKA